ncbi:MAG: hypothetical protein QXX77_10520 [Candidatus Methanosuratincola sp.]
MKENLDYLFWGHASLWILIFAYLLNLLIKGNRLAKEILALKERRERGEDNT